MQTVVTAGGKKAYVGLGDAATEVSLRDQPREVGYPGWVSALPSSPNISKHIMYHVRHLDPGHLAVDHRRSLLLLHQLDDEQRDPSGRAAHHQHQTELHGDEDQRGGPVAADGLQQGLRGQHRLRLREEADVHGQLHAGVPHRALLVLAVSRPALTWKYNHRHPAPLHVA